MSWLERLKEWFQKPLDPSLKSFVYLKYSVPHCLGTFEDDWSVALAASRAGGPQQRRNWLDTLPDTVIVRVFEILRKKEYIASTFQNLDQARTLINMWSYQAFAADIIIHELCKYELSQATS